jgi:large subunit ribosomal protein L23
MKTKETYGVVVRPLITEQGMHLANVKGAYPFEVDKRSNKAEIRAAIEKVYNVKVRKVRTSNHRGKSRRKGRFFGRTENWKKAVVYLEPDYHIDLF